MNKKKKLLEQAEQQLAEMKEKFGLKEAELSSLRNEVSKFVKAKNYETHYPAPDFLTKKKKLHPQACFIQILGARYG